MTTTEPASQATSCQHEAFVGLGANLGEPVGTLRRALQRLASLPATILVAQSSPYRTEPVDAGGPDYINAVALLRTQLSAADLLSALQTIENEAGRERLFRNAPRTLDLDLLLYDKLRQDSARLTLPHPRMHLRAFVLAPLAEIVPDLILEPYGAVSSLLAALQDQQPYERLEPFPREQ